MACNEIVYPSTVPACGDGTNILLGKILQATNDVPPVSVGDVTLAVSDLEIGAVEIKDGTSNTRAVVRTSDPAAGDAGIVVRIAGGAVDGGLTNAELRASAVPVSGTFFQVTQPISGSVSVSNFPASQAVTGTFFQATQPVSIATTVAVSSTQLPAALVGGDLRVVIMASEEVPVIDNGGSLTVDAPVTTPVFVRLSDGTNPLAVLPVSGPLTDVQLRATPVPVSGSLALSGTVSTKTALTASAPVMATVGVVSAQIVAANANRKGLILVNISANTISLGFGSAAVLNSGVTLLSGYAYNMAEYDFHVGAVNAIASAASSDLPIQEYTT